VDVGLLFPPTVSARVQYGRSRSTDDGEPDRAKGKRASDAMLKMVKIDVAALQAAFAGSGGR